MAWMALFVICTVTPEQNGWRPNLPTPGTPPAAVNPAGNTQPPATPYTQPPQGTPTPAGNPVAPPPTTSGAAASSYWTQLQDALAAPVSRNPTAGPSGASGSPTQMRQAAGVQFPPAPPGSPRGASASSFPSTTPQNEVLPPNSSGQTANPRAPNREILYEGDARGNFYQRPVGYRGKTYITPPQADGAPTGLPPDNRTAAPLRDGASRDPIASRPGLALPRIPPPGNAAQAEDFDQRHQTQRVNTSGQPSESATAGPVGADPTGASGTQGGVPTSTTSDRWWPLLLTLLGLFGSVGFNLYLGWIAWDLHGRYQDVVADLRDLENQFDERAGELASERSGRHDSRRVAALAS